MQNVTLIISRAVKEKASTCKDGSIHRFWNSILLRCAWFHFPQETTPRLPRKTMRISWKLWTLDLSSEKLPWPPLQWCPSQRRAGTGPWPPELHSRLLSSSLSMTFKNKSCIQYYNCRLGEEFEEDTTDGRKCKTTVTMDDNKLITSQKAVKSGEKDVRVVREFNADGLTMKMTTEGVTCTQVYKRT